MIPKLVSKERAWYFFGYYEGIRIRSASNATALVPTAAELSGNFTGDAPIYNPYTTATQANGTSSRQPFPAQRALLGTAVYGTITSVRNSGRQVQVAMKFHF